MGHMFKAAGNHETLPLLRFDQHHSIDSELLELNLTLGHLIFSPQDQ